MLPNSEHFKNRIYKNRFAIYLILILMVALALRIWGISFGLPHIYHTDEWFEVKRALKLGEGVIDYNRISKGGYFYLLFIEYGVYFVILKLIGAVKSGSDFLYKILLDPTQLWLISRITTAVIGTINCYLLYLLGKKTHSTLTGICAAGFMATNMVHVQSSHYIAVDIPLTCLLTFCLLIMFWKSNGEKFGNIEYIILGLAVALTIATKITGAVIFFPILFFHYRNTKLETNKFSVIRFLFDKRIIFFGLSFALFYIIFNPGIIFHIKGLYYWLFSFIDFSNSVLVKPQFPQPAFTGSLLYYYLNVIFPARYILLTIFILGGVVVGFKDKFPGRYSFLTFTAVYLFFLSNSKSIELVYPRYILPLTPIFFIYAAIFVSFLRNHFAKNSFGKMAIAVLIAVSVFFPIKDTVSFNQDLTKPDTRTIAKQWVFEHISANNKIIIEGSLYKVSTVTVPLQMNPDLVDDAMAEYLQGNNSDSKKAGFYRILKKSLRNKKNYHLILTANRQQLSKALSHRDVDYIIILEKTAKLVMAIDENKILFPELFQVVSWAQSSDFELVKSFKPGTKTTGPSLLIYKRINNV